MGIKDLWTILTPFCERKPLYELQGKTVAVDLSGWVCQAQTLSNIEHTVQPRMYLRNLYFRTCYMLLQDIRPVYVLEGETPTLKYKTVAIRNAIKKGAKAKEAKEVASSKKGRSRFNSTLKLCQDMLKIMGLACITGLGEAEAMCAYLDENGLVDGCISQDSDCFAYGAKVVYRNFSISQQGSQAGTGGSIDVYDLRKAIQALGFGRNKIIVLALLCGSDYNEGVPGVGKESAIKLFSSISDDKILNHIKNWRVQESKYAQLEKEVLDKKMCNNCCHLGAKATHTRLGCGSCGTRKGCNINEKRAELKNEISIRSKALEDNDFPDKELISEFMLRKDNVTNLNLDWKKPDIKKFVSFTLKYMQWEEVYSFEKLFPVLTRWHILNYNKSAEIKPDFIKKIRNPKGLPSYEIVWDASNFAGLIPDEQLKDLEINNLYSTIEPQDLVQKAYPQLVETFEQSKIKPKKAKIVKEKKAPKNPRKTKPKNLIDQFLLKEFCKNNVSDLDSSRFGDEDDDIDMSLIIEDIVSRDLPEVIKNKLNKITQIERKVDLNASSFFIQEATDDIDLFEATFNRVESDESSSDEVDGQNDEIDDQNDEVDNQNDEGHCKTFISESEDSFIEEYVPLYERIKNKS